MFQSTPQNTEQNNDLVNKSNGHTPQAKGIFAVVVAGWKINMLMRVWLGQQ